MTTIAERLTEIHERIDRAARRAARAREDVQLIAVSKTQPASAIREAFAAGQRLFGENYAQELVRKAAELADVDVVWHFIGALQRNKAKDVLPVARMIHTVDRTSLIDTLDARASARIDVLVEVNVSSEPQKSGVEPAALVALAAHAAATKHVRVAGLMSVPEATEDPESVRPSFAKLRTLRDDLVTRGLSGGALSMGMSHDFEIAIEEGATIVRVGTAIFGQRPPAEAR